MDWAEALAVQPLGEGRFRARVDERWTSLQGVHGGIVAAIALTAAERVLAGSGVDAATSLRAATFGYARGNSVGDLTIEIEVVRRGRAMVTSHARVVQDGDVTTVARFHHSTPWPGLELDDAPPMPARPAGTVPLAVGEQPAHLHNVETSLHPATTIFAGTDRAELIAWSRPLGTGTFDVAWLTMFGDYFPPAVFTRATAPLRAVTVEYSIQVHRSAGPWTLGPEEHLTARMHAFLARDGFAVEDGWIYLPDGSLLATTRQTRLAG
jgi:acyl-CoA thioesterase